MTTDHDGNQKRWTAKRRAALALEILRGDTSVAEAARNRALTVAEIEEWHDRFLSGAEHARRRKPRRSNASTNRGRAGDGYRDPLHCGRCWASEGGDPAGQGASGQRFQDRVVQSIAQRASRTTTVVLAAGLELAPVTAAQPVTQEYQNGAIPLDIG